MTVICEEAKTETKNWSDDVREGLKRKQDKLEKGCWNREVWKKIVELLKIPIEL